MDFQPDIYKIEIEMSETFLKETENKNTNTYNSVNLVCVSRKPVGTVLIRLLSKFLREKKWT